MGDPSTMRLDRTLALRWAAFGVSTVVALLAAWLVARLSEGERWTLIDTLRLLLSTVCVFWVTWGSMSGVLGLLVRTPRLPPRTASSTGRTAILMPIYNEDPPSTFARVAAISARLVAIGAHDAFDIMILSDTQSLDAAARETMWLDRLLTDCPGREHIFYRRRPLNSGRKAGNIEEFVRRSGGAYDYAVVLDADSLMEAESIVAMVREMDAAPDLGLLQTLPQIVHARSLFGRALQFSAAYYGPAFARGTALMQGREGPYWGHNAIFRVRAFAQSCALPQLRGRPPFGGHVLSHDYVEAALLARAGHAVRLDPAIAGSFEEGPDNIVDFAKRDQRWCQGNLQHSRIVLAPALRFWNRVTLLQGILSYLMPSLWLALLVVSITATEIARPVLEYDFYDFYGIDAVPRPVPEWANWALVTFVAAILIVPKLLIALRHILSGRSRAAGGPLLLLLSVVAEIVLSTLIAPIVLMFQVRAVLRVLFGVDGGWPASNRTDGVLTFAQAWAGSWWIACCGGALLAVVIEFASTLTGWALPVALPMLFAPAIIAISSRRVGVFDRLWRVPSEARPGPVLEAWEQIHTDWTASPAVEQNFTGTGAIDVLG